jgi:hypothetical protein
MCPRIVSPSAESIRALLKYTRPYCDVSERDQIIRAVHQATGGSADGLAMTIEWHQRRPDYPGPESLQAKWHAIAPERDSAAGFETLRNLVESNGFDWIDICARTEPDFEICDYEVVDADGTSSPSEPAEELTSLDKYSLTTRRHEVERTAVEPDFVMGRLAIRGQLSAYFGPPNIGKTAIAMALLERAAREGMIDARRCYVLDFDTDANGLLAKIDYAKATGINVLSDGYLGFSSRKFLEEMEQMIASGQALGTVVVLDTIKQHVSIMQKDESAEFAKRLRRFSKAGGTCIVMAHVNKSRGLDGRPVHAGTTDLVELFDACFLVYEVETDAASQTRTVLFESFKARGQVAKRASYRYSIAEGLTYPELLASVAYVDKAETAEIEKSKQVREDAGLCEAIAESIAAGVVAKMEILAAVTERCGTSRRAVQTVLERYTGSDPKQHRWTYAVHARGEKRFQLLAGSLRR